MSETILSRAIRGLSTSLRFTGSTSGPPGIDLSRASTPVNDLTQYARYGSALVFHQLQDGWTTATFVQPFTEAGFLSENQLWDTQVSGDFGIPQNALANMMCWIYSVSQSVSVNTDFGDVGPSKASITVARGIGDVGTGSSSHDIWLNAGGVANVIPIGATACKLVNLVRLPTPIPWAPGSNLNVTGEQVGANPRTIQRNWSFLVRLLPFGVPPPPE